MLSARWFRHIFNVYPPYLGAGIHVDEIAPDWRRIRVRMRLTWFNRNYVRTQFGGSLYAMTDPFLMIMALRNLGPGYVVWDKAAQIEFVAPGRGTVHARFELGEAQLDDMRRHTADGQKYLPWFEVEVRGDDGELVARVRKQLYVRRKRARAAAATDGASDRRPASQ
jgi:acyl-coenzyme A thioesterase PaaI-like protein